MKNFKIALFLSLSFLALMLSGCAVQRKPVPVGVVPAPRRLTQEDEAYGRQVLNELQQHFDVDNNHQEFPRLARILNRLTVNAGATVDPWKLYIFDDSSVKNAAATRGNYVLFWEGMFRTANTDDEIATILSHEIAHVISGHTDSDPNMEMRKILINVGALAAGAAANASGVSGVGNAAAGLTQSVGEGVLVNPYSRELELEADQVGLFIMADAGYDPLLALDFWEKLAKDPAFSSSVEFFSSHPIAGTRIDNLKKILPDALRRYKNNRANLASGGYNNLANRNQGSRSQDSSWMDKYQTPEGRDRQQGGNNRDGSYGNHSNDHYQSNSYNRQPEQGEPARKPLSEDDSFRVYRSREPIPTCWEVNESRAVLYQAPSRFSIKLGELRRGAKIEAVAQQGGWVEVNSPEHGFLEVNDLKPLMTRDR